MTDSQLTKEALFNELDRSNDDRISLAELQHFVESNVLIEGLLAGDVEKLFSFLDSNSNGFISIDEFCTLV